MHKVTRRVLIAALASIACAMSTATQAAAVGLQTRPADPVVLTGSKLSSLIGVKPSRIVAFRWSGGWQQKPVQVDERAHDRPRRRLQLRPPAGVTALTYTDSSTFVGPDSDPNLDGNDEVSMMSRDSGAKAPANAKPSGTVAGAGSRSRCAIRWPPAPSATSTCSEATARAAPRPGRATSSTTSTSLSGGYKSTYDTASRAEPRELNGPLALLRPALLRPLDRRPAAPALGRRERRRHPRPPQEPLLSG